MIQYHQTLCLAQFVSEEGVDLYIPHVPDLGGVHFREQVCPGQFELVEEALNHVFCLGSVGMELVRPEEELDESVVPVRAKDSGGDVLLPPVFVRMFPSRLGEDDHEGYGNMGPLWLEVLAEGHRVL